MTRRFRPRGLKPERLPHAWMTRQLRTKKVSLMDCNHVSSKAIITDSACLLRSETDLDTVTSRVS
eukprot:scaffold652431_cov41-Prasinocladus_malaysianus.AAC.1